MYRDYQVLGKITKEKEWRNEECRMFLFSCKSIGCIYLMAASVEYKHTDYTFMFPACEYIYAESLFQKISTI